MVFEMTLPAQGSRTSHNRAVISFLYYFVQPLRSLTACASRCGFAQSLLSPTADCAYLHLSTLALLQRNSQYPSDNGLRN